MFGRRYITVLLVAAFSTVGCEEGLPTEPTVPLAVELSSAPATLTAVPSTGVTIMVDGAPVVLPWKASFAVVMNLEVDHEPVAIISVTNLVRQAVGGVIVTPTAPDRELFLFDQRPRDSRLEPGGEGVIEFDVWYLLPNGGREASVNIGVSFTSEIRGAFNSTIEIPVAP
jgi:hypothetical protein